MKKRVLAVCMAVVVLCGAAASANGGPEDGAAPLVGGNIRFADTPDIRVEKEDLTIVLSPRTSIVTAEYTLKNTGPARALDYVFPVTQYVDNNYGENRIAWIYFYDGGQKLTCAQRDETTRGGEGQASVTLGGQEMFYDYIRNTYYETSLRFAEGESKTLTVTYKAGNGFSGWGTNQALLSDYSDTVFLYDLSPAAAWGDGKAGEFNLWIDYADLPVARSLSVNMPGFVRQPSGIYRYAAQSFDFAAQGMIAAVFDHPIELDELAGWQKNDDWLSEGYVSSTLPDEQNRYGIANLFDNDPDTVWASDGDGVGATIELLFDAGTSFGVLNGHVRNEQLYYDNARVKTMQVEVIHLLDGGEMDVSDPVTLEFEDIPYEKIDTYYPWLSLSLFYQGDWLPDGVRLTISEVYPGRKYKEVCISEIYLFSRIYWEETRAGYTIRPASLIDSYVAPSASPSPSPVPSAAPSPIHNTPPPVSASPDTSAEPTSYDPLPAVLLALGLLLAAAGGLAVYRRVKPR